MDGSLYLRDNEDRMAWIMGSSRSGSTWLLRMLRELRPVVGIDDPHLGHHLGVWRPVPIAWTTGTRRPQLTTLPELKRDKDDYLFSDRYREAWLPGLRELGRGRFGAQLDEQRRARVTAPVLVIKEPGSHAAELIFEAFPRSRLVFLLRDGRDVVDSWVDAYRSGSWAIDEGAFEVAPDGRLALVEWLASVWAYRARAVGAAFAEREEDARILIRYEELLADPARELARICRVIGVRPRPGELAAIAERHAFSNVDCDQRGSGRAIRAAAPGSWRHNLTRDERQAMEEIMGPQLSAFGYRSEIAAAA